ncbi:MAG TPA: hypothetical protein VNE63_20485 [Candidatus Acidoferrales bacterium]|nr:hypothetical protein [Candidatus Acidoferrales bacterium]
MDKMIIVDRWRQALGFAWGPMVVVAFLFAFPLRAQQQQSPTTDPSSQSDSQGTENQQNERETGHADQIAPKNDRLFGVIPNYTTVENEDRFSPLSAKGKFKLAVDSSFDPYTFPFIGFIALVGQAENSEPSYGQGMSGYAKRYGTSYGDAIIGTFMTTSIFPSLLHQDPRYYQLGEGRITHRTYYAVSRIFVTRTDSQHEQFNFSEIGGNAAAAGLSNIYHPAEDRSFANTMSVWGTDIMWDTVANVAKEFWPDIRRKITHKSQQAAPTP